MKTEFTISKKLSAHHAIDIEGGYIRVGRLIEDNPLYLWNLIHSKGSDVNLTRDTYYQLHERIKKYFPEVWEANERKKRKIASQRKFRNHQGRFLYLGKSHVTVKST